MSARAAAESPVCAPSSTSQHLAPAGVLRRPTCGAGAQGWASAAQHPVEVCVTVAWRRLRHFMQMPVTAV